MYLQSYLSVRKTCLAWQFGQRKQRLYHRHPRLHYCDWLDQPCRIAFVCGLSRTVTRPDCIHHTDRGSHYCSNEYQKRLSKHMFKVSMSGKGNCYDNSMVETFFKSIKVEMIWRNRWETRRQAEGAIFQYINGFYNPRRRHSSLGGKSPLAFERRAA